MNGKKAKNQVVQVRWGRIVALISAILFLAAGGIILYIRTRRNAGELVIFPHSYFFVILSEHKTQNEAIQSAQDFRQDGIGSGFFMQIEEDFFTVYSVFRQERKAGSEVIRLIREGLEPRIVEVTSESLYFEVSVTREAALRFYEPFLSIHSLFDSVYFLQHQAEGKRLSLRQAELSIASIKRRVNTAKNQVMSDITFEFRDKILHSFFDTIQFSIENMFHQINLDTLSQDLQYLLCVIAWEYHATIEEAREFRQ